MTQINIYFQAVTKVSVAHIKVDDDTNIEDLMKKWFQQGYVQAHYNDARVWIYIPWSNVVYCQYAE